MTRVHSLSVIDVPNGREIDYVAFCSCGWESLPWTSKRLAERERCQVMQAEVDGEKRRSQRLATSA